MMLTVAPSPTSSHELRVIIQARRALLTWQADDALSASHPASSILDLCLDAILELEKLRLAVANQLATQAYRLAKDSLEPNSPLSHLPAILLAQVAYEQGRIAEADALLRYRLPAIRKFGTDECAVRAYPLL